MTTFVPMLVMTLNYSHDIATALLATSGAALWMLSRHYPSAVEPGAEAFFVRVHYGLTRLAKYSLIWVLLAGVPRIAVYRTYDWADSAGDLQIVVIALKHAVMFLLVGAGLFYWVKLGRKAKELRSKGVC